MRNDSNIVSFEDAKRSVRGRFVSQTQLISEDGHGARSKRARALKDARAAKETRDPQEEREEEPELNLKKAKKKAKAKAKAEKAFNKMYGDDSASNKGILGKITGKGNAAAAADSAGPRAAVYKGEMGAKHRKAAAMQSGKPSGFPFALPFSFNFGRSRSKEDAYDDAPSPKGFASRKMSKGGKVLFRLGVSAACLFVFCAAIYAPAQQCYVQIRERDRLAAEYEAVMERNDILENNVDNLQSEPGIEDLAHSSFGLIKDGENAGSVSGLNLNNKSTFTAKVIPGSVPAPDTWYSGVLDWLFGYSS